MAFKNRYGLPVLILFTMIGSGIVATILTFLFQETFYIGIIFFIIVTAFLIKIMIKGSIRKIVFEEKNVCIYQKEMTPIPYETIRAVYIVSDFPRRVNTKRDQRELTLRIVYGKDIFMDFPYVGFGKHFHSILQGLRQKNPSIQVDPVVSFPKGVFDEKLNLLHTCRISPEGLLNNPYTK